LLLEEYLRRTASYRSARSVPPPGGVLEMVYAACVSYERRLTAVSGNPAASRLALDTVVQGRLAAAERHDVWLTANFTRA
jgi:hypothetical protein